MKLSLNFRASVIAVIAAAALSFVSFGVNRLQAQNAGQFIRTLLGTESVQIQSQVNNTAAITYTTVGSLRDGRQWLYQVPLTGFSITMTVSQSVVALNPAGTLAAGAIVMPPTQDDGKTVTFFSTAIVTALTVTTSNSATFAPAVVTALAANVPVSYVYDLANNQWHRFQ